MKINPSSAHRSRRGYTVFEILIVLVIIGALASVLIVSASKSHQGASDTQKTENAKKLTGAASSIWQANVDITGWTDATSAINAIKAGITLPASVEGGAPYPVHIDSNPNPAAYTYTAPDAAGHGPRFDPILGHPEVLP